MSAVYRAGAEGFALFSRLCVMDATTRPGVPAVANGGSRYNPSMPSAMPRMLFTCAVALAVSLHGLLAPVRLCIVTEPQAMDDAVEHCLQSPAPARFDASCAADCAAALISSSVPAVASFVAPPLVIAAPSVVFDAGDPDRLDRPPATL